MASLRRSLSLDCTDHTSLQSNGCVLARHHSFPVVHFYCPQGLPSLPFPSSRSFKARHCSGRPGSSYSGHKRDSPPYQYAFSHPASTWCEDDEVLGGACTATQPVFRNESLDMENSIVYKDLYESIRHLESPPRYVQVLNSEGMSGSGRACVEAELSEEDSMKKMKLEPSSIDVRVRPVSLQRLKREVSGVSNSPKTSDAEQGMLGQFPVPGRNLESRHGILRDMGSSVNGAFSSLVYMMESLQQHTLWLRTFLMSEADSHLHVMMSKAHQEIQETFLWLFQQVFSCTPKLMLLTMILLVDFAVHSMGKHVALGVMPMGEPPTCIIERAITSKAPSFDVSSDGLGSTYPKTCVVTTNLIQGSLAEPGVCEGGAGNKDIRSLQVGGSMDGEAMPTTHAERVALSAEDDTYRGLNDGSFCGYGTLHEGNDSEEHHMLFALWQQEVLKERNLMTFTEPRHMIVAPVQAPALEADDYPCYDRTDLKYQHELSRDPSNPLLLANYAQFLHVVRHDHDRAEVLYKKALKVDPVDGEVMGKYASFLWVAKEDMEGADEAYRTAMAVDPTNAYHAGSYAHFLWNSSSGQDDIASITTSTYQQVFMS